MKPASMLDVTLALCIMVVLVVFVCGVVAAFVSVLF